MSKLSKAIAVLGVVAGLGVSALPLSSYAATYGPIDDNNGTVTADSQVKVEVNSIIAITLSGDSFTSTTEEQDTVKNVLGLGKVDAGKFISAPLTVGVTTNSVGGFTLSIKSKTSDTAMKSGSYSINALASDGTMADTGEVSTSAWGYKGGDVTSWKGVTDTNAAVKTTAVYAADEVKTDVTFGVAVNKTQQSGVYTADVVFTATAN